MFAGKEVEVDFVEFQEPKRSNMFPVDGQDIRRWPDLVGE